MAEAARAKTTMILRFDDDSDRQAFLNRLARERRDIFERCDPANVLPDVMCSELDEEQQRWLRERLGQRAFADVRFETF